MKSLITLLSRFGRIFKYGERINPTRDWFLLLTIAGLILCLSVGWNVWLFSRVTSGEAIGTATSTAVTTTLDGNSIQTLFDARSTERGKYVSTYRFVDPSL
ncbi:hypothetical protein BH11PAT2_BH11PAT2_09030 [soil metagenome]